MVEVRTDVPFKAAYLLWIKAERVSCFQFVVF